jgi:hypothetical protein
MLAESGHRRGVWTPIFTFRIARTAQLAPEMPTVATFGQCAVRPGDWTATRNRRDVGPRRHHGAVVSGKVKKQRRHHVDSGQQNQRWEQRRSIQDLRQNLRSNRFRGNCRICEYPFTAYRSPLSRIRLSQNPLKTRCFSSKSRWIPPPIRGNCVIVQYGRQRRQTNGETR